MNVLSLFDGLSCGQIALERAGIAVDNYFASEIDPYAIKIAMKNYPKTKQLGNITDWKKWDIPKPDIVIGGSPCQGFSFAGKMLNFDDPRSKLFLEFHDILKHYKPKHFLLENVIMLAQPNDVISSMLGDLYPECVEQTQFFKTGRLEPIMINSALVSAQNRKRLYWTNIPGITQPEDRGILLRDIIEHDFEKDRRQLIRSKSKTLRTGGFTSKPDDRHEWNNIGFVNRIGTIKDGKIDNRIYDIDGKSPSLMSQSGGTASSGSALIGCKQIGEADIKGFDSRKRVYGVDGKSPTLIASLGGHHEAKISQDNITWRKLTPLECERLQTVSDGYSAGISNSRRYHALGNGWTVEVIAHIFSFLPKEYKK